MALNSLKKNIGTPIADGILGNGKSGARQLVRDLLGFRAEKGGPGNKASRGKKVSKNTQIMKMIKNVSAGKAPKQRSSAKSGISITGDAGGIVQSANAPVAFARNEDMKPFSKILKATADGLVVHTVDYIGPCGTPAGNGFATMQTIAMNPLLSGLGFTSKFAGEWSKYKLKALKLHYVHFAPTSAQSKIMMTWMPDPLAIVPTTSATMVPLNGCMVGACYEDFSYTADIKEDQSDWLFVGSTVASRTNTSGYAIVACDLTTAASQNVSVGDLYIESVWEFVSRTVTTNAPIARLIGRVLDEEKDPQQRRVSTFKLLANALKAIEDEEIAAAKKKKEREVIEKAIDDDMCKALGLTSLLTSQVSQLTLQKTY